MSRKEFMKRWLDRERLGWPSVRVRQEHTHIDSLYTVTIEGGVEAVQLVGDKEGSTDVLACVGGSGREGNGLWVTLFMGSEVTSLGLSKHMKITVELCDE